MTELPDLLIVSKSSWKPSIRREHALAHLAIAAGHRVAFIERPMHIRAALGRDWHTWLRSLARPEHAHPDEEIDVVARSTLLPGHLNAPAESFEGWLLRRQIGEPTGGVTPTLVATLPWHWPAISRLWSYRRVLDVAEDWSALIPGRRDRVLDLYARAAEEADEIIVASEGLRELFPGREVTVVRNGVDDELLDPPRRPRPRLRRLVYAGTLSERFDVRLVRELLFLRPGWTLDLYGPCAYAGRGAKPDPELEGLLAWGNGRVRWHGSVARSHLANVLDDSDVLLLPNRSEHSLGQDWMKVYDYAARGRPIVATKGAAGGMSEPPPHLYLGTGGEEIATQVLVADAEPDAYGDRRARWAASQRWDSRWPQWSRALFGEPFAGPSDREQLCYVPTDQGSVPDPGLAVPARPEQDFPVVTENQSPAGTERAQILTPEGPGGPEQDRAASEEVEPLEVEKARKPIGPLTLRSAALCLVISLVAAAGAYAIGLALPSVYQSNGTFRVVVPTQIGIQDPNVTAGNDLATQYAQLASSNDIRDLTARRLGVTPSSLNGKIVGSTVAAQNIVQVTASGSSQSLAQDRTGAALASLRSYVEHLNALLNVQYVANVKRGLTSPLIAGTAGSAKVTPVTPVTQLSGSLAGIQAQVLGQVVRDAAGNQPALQTVDPANSASKTSPRPPLYAVVAFIVALLITSRLAFVLGRRRPAHT
jgi:capsular polysaccharide biosynthesis protein